MKRFGFEVSVYIDAEDENEAFAKLADELDGCSDIYEWKEHYCDEGYPLNDEKK